MSKDIPARFIFEADQGYAYTQQRLDKLLSDLADQMVDRDTDDATPWATSVLMIREGRLTPELTELGQAAIYRLARQELARRQQAKQDTCDT